MTLIFTHSCDKTTDLLLRYVERPDQVIRFNFDLYEEYSVMIRPGDFRIEDPIGRVISRETVSKGYYRKPTTIDHGPGEMRYQQQEEWTAYRAIIQMVSDDGRMVLVERPFEEKTRLNKLRQLELARDYFDVSPAVFTNRPHQLTHWDHAVTKSLNSGNLGNRALFTTRVQPKELSNDMPWYLQELVEATHDVTIVYVDGQQFGFELDRSILGECLDCRSGDNWGKWAPCHIDRMFASQIQRFMHSMELRFGRLDFLRRSDGEHTFLEVNPNGQFGWLDLHGIHGVLKAVARHISPTSNKPSPQIEHETV